jgi:uncharacterized membrane protein YfcA
MTEFLLFVAAGFLAQMIDGTISMGYGVSATSLLLSFGVAPAAASASVHTAEVVSTAFSAYHHWREERHRIVREEAAHPRSLGAIAGAYV